MIRRLRQLFLPWNFGYLAALLIIGTALGWIAYDEYRQAKEFEFRLLEAHARNAEAQVNEVLTKIGRLLERIGEKRLNNQSWPDKEFSAIVRQYNLPAVDMLFLTDSAGKIEAATDAAAIGKNVSGEPYFLAREAPRKLFISRPDKRLRKTSVVIISLPLTDAENRFRGIAAVAIDSGFFPGVLQAINPDDSGSMSVIYNRDGDILFRRENPEIYFGHNITKVSEVFQEHANAGMKVTRHIGFSRHRDKTLLFLVRDVKDTGLSLVLSRPLSDVLESSSWTRNSLLYLLFLIFTVAITFAFAITTSRRKQSELARIEALGRIRKIASQVPGVVYQYRLHPDGHSDFPFASDAIREIFRLSPEEVREDASKIFTLIHPDDHEKIIASIHESAQKLAPWQHEFRVKFDDGAVRWLHGNSLPQKEADGVVLWHGFITDITERKELDAEIADNRERLRQIEERQLLSQERQRLMQDMHDGLGSSLVSALRVVERGRLGETEIADVLKGCIDDLKLAIDSMEPVEADLLLLLATLRFRLGPRLESSGIRLRWQVEDVPALDWLDPRNALHILRILQEAFANIIKHTGATEIRVATHAECDHVAVTITDNGKGFDLEDARHSGGKGLSNQMRRAEAIGAEIQWNSNSDGTCLTLRLPQKRAA